MIRLEPAGAELAQAVLAGQPLPDPALKTAPDWPHAGTADALRPLADHPAEQAEGTFLVVADGVVVGECGVRSPLKGEVEIGYGVAPSARRQGVGVTAVELLVRWAFERGADAVRAEVLPGNEASLRLLARLGFHRAGERAGHVLLVRGREAQRSAKASFQTGS